MSEVNQETKETKEEATQEEVKEEKVQPEVNEKGSQKEEVKEEVKTFTEAEVEKMLQAMTDKRVTEALKTAKGKWQAEYEENLAKEKAEAERLAKLSAKERQQEEFKKMQAEIDNERAEFAKEREQFLHEKLMLSTVKKLNAEGMPAEFADFLVGKDEETTLKNIEAFKDQWQNKLQNSIEKHVESRLKGSQPQASNDNGEGKMMSRKEFANLPTNVRMQMMKDDPELVKKILAQKH